VSVVNESMTQFLLILHYDSCMPPAHLESLPGQEPSPSGSRWFWPLVAGLLAAMGFLQISSIRQESQTWDEAVELAGGYRYLKTGEYRFFIEHPPLGKILVALPLLLLDPVLPADDPAPGDFRHVQYGSRFLYRNKVPAESMLFAARLVTISVTLSLGLVLALWTRRAFGPGAAVFALLLYSFDPNILAQGRYTKSGLLLTLLGFLAVVLWGRYLERPLGATLAATGVVFGLALATKFSAAFLVPVFAGLHIVQWRRRGRPGPVRSLIPPHLVVAMLEVRLAGDRRNSIGLPAFHGVLQPAGGRSRQRRELPGRFESRLGPGPQEAEDVHRPAWNPEGLPVVFRHRGPEIPRHRFRDFVRPSGRGRRVRDGCERDAATRPVRTQGELRLVAAAAA